MPPEPLMSTQSWLIFSWIVATFTFLVGIVWGASSGYRRGCRETARIYEGRHRRRYRYEAQDVVSDPYSEEG